MSEVLYRDYKIVSSGKPFSLVIKPVGRGSVPSDLKGSYTNSTFAMQKIDAFLDKKEKGRGAEKNSG